MFKTEPIWEIIAIDAITYIMYIAITSCSTARAAGRMVDILVRAVETTKSEGSRRNLLKILTAGNCDQDNSEDDSDRDDYEEARDYDEIDDCDSQQAAGAGSARPTPGAAPGSCLNYYERFCCRFAAGAAIGNNRFNS